MNRSGWITGVVVAQALWALALIGIAVFLIVLARMATPDISSGLKIGALTLAAPALLAAISWYGLGKGMLWGWWLAFFTDFALMAILIYSMVDDGLRYIDWDMAAMTATSAILPVFLLTPVVRNFFWRSTPKQAANRVK
jgi:hypothetical protein